MVYAEELLANCGLVSKVEVDWCMIAPSALTLLMAAVCLTSLVGRHITAGRRLLSPQRRTLLRASSRPCASSMTALVPGILRDVVSRGDTVIDATCGNGHDSFTLASLALAQDRGFLICYDIQPTAIEATKARLSELDVVTPFNVDFRCESHRDLGRDLDEGSVKAIVYNLGYLPGGNKSIITQREDTLASLRNAVPLLARGGIISIMCYQGHEGGREELIAVHEFCSGLDCEMYIVQRHELLNRPLAPVLLTIYRNELCPKEPPRRISDAS